MLGLNDKSVGDIGPQEILKYIEQQKFEDNQSPELQDLLRKVKGESDENCEEVSPTPGFVVKTSDENGRKVFVNICGNDRVAAPGGWEDGKIPEDVQKALSVSSEELSQAQQELLRFPLSLGERYHDLDNKGVPCIVYDVIFHADIIQQCSAVRKLKIFVVELSLGWIQHKQQCKLDPKYKLPKMKYKGDIIRTQRIRVDKQKFITDLGDVLEEPEFPLLTKTAPPAKKSQKIIEEIQQPTKNGSSNSGKNISKKKDENQENTNTNQITQTTQKSQQDESLNIDVEYVGRPVEYALLKLSGFRQKIDQSTIVSCQVRGRDIRVKLKHHALIQKTLLFAVDSANSQIEVNCQQNLILIKLPHLDIEAYVNQLEKNQPHKFGELGLSSSSYMELDI